MKKEKTCWNMHAVISLATIYALRICIILLLCYPLASDARAQGETEIRVGSVLLKVPDSTLTNQDGERVKFYSDLIKGKVVVISFFYTSCTYICSIQGEIFSALQSELGSRLGKDVFLISVSTDPETDVPEKLKYWSENYGRRKGWSVVTGSKEEMNKLLMAFTRETAGKRDMHSSLVYIGNDRLGVWTGFEGISGPEILSKVISEISKGNPGMSKP